MALTFLPLSFIITAKPWTAGSLTERAFGIGIYNEYMFGFAGWLLPQNWECAVGEEKEKDLGRKGKAKALLWVSM